MEKLDIEFFTSSAAVKNAVQPSPFDGTELSHWAGVSAKTKGTIAEKVIEEYFIHLNYEVNKPKNKGHDLIVLDKKIEAKFSTLNRGYGYIWNQIRPNSDFDYIIFMALNPSSLNTWWTTKEKIIEYTNGMGQHNGNDSENRMLSHAAGDIPNVFTKFNPIRKQGLLTTITWPT